MAVSEADRRLRIIQFCCWFPTLALGIPTAIEANHAFFAMGIIPITFSAIHAILLLHTRLHQRMIGLSVSLDWVLGLTILCFLVPHWVGTSQGWGWNWRSNTNGWAILSTFASTPMLVTFCIHTFFAFIDLPLVPALAGFFSCSTCPHCQHEVPRRDLRLLWDLTPGASASNSSAHSHETIKQGYVHLPAAEAGEYTEGDKAPEVSESKDGVEDEGTPRASMEGENARLL